MTFFLCGGLIGLMAGIVFGPFILIGVFLLLEKLGYAIERLNLTRKSRAPRA